MERWNAHGHGLLHLERAGTGWRVDGGLADSKAPKSRTCRSRRSATLPIRRTPVGAGESLPLDTAFIDGPALTVARSRQRYDRQAPAVRYVDLGLRSALKRIWWSTIPQWCCITSTCSSGSRRPPTCAPFAKALTQTVRISFSVFSSLRLNLTSKLWVQRSRAPTISACK